MKTALVIATVALAAAAHAQGAGQRDSTRVNALDPVVITAERAPTAVSTTTSAVSRIGAESLRRTPHVGFADLLRLVPGFAVVDFDGAGRDPQLMLRGFYGGGEAEYVVVLVDGQPVNQLHTGLVRWDALPNVSSIEAIEVVRGSASPLYGDAALGGVINIITRQAAAATRAAWNVSGGSYDSWQGGFDVTGPLGRRAAAASLGLDRTRGFRQHGERSVAQASASLQLISSTTSNASLRLSAHRRAFDDPGALLDSLVDRERKSSDPLFRFDHTDDRGGVLTLTGSRSLSSRTRLSSSAWAELREVDAVRSLALAPGFGDTRERVAATTRGTVVAQLNINDATLGAELAYGGLDSRYYEVVTGPRDAYAAADGSRGGLSASGDATRATAALFGQLSLQLTPAIRFSLGMRADWLRDAFQPNAPSNGARVTASHGALSPKAGLNFKYAASGHVYISASRSFKAPTLDQLFDQRPIPVPFPPFSLTTSNSALDPQYGTNLETGFAHTLAHGDRVVSLSGSVYQIQMKDELDFNVAMLRYVNIGRSRHRGAELGLSVTPAGPFAFFGNYALQAVTARAGENQGKALKAIPRHVLSAGLDVTPRSLFDLRIVASQSRAMFLDDANTRSLQHYTRVDAQLARRVGAVELLIMARNLFDARFNSSGFLDPSGSGRAYYYPAAARLFSLGVRSAS